MQARLARCVVVFLILVSLQYPAFAAERASEPDAASSSPRIEQPAVAEKSETDQSKIAKTVIDRSFRYSKRNQHELGFFGGDYLGDEWLNTWDVGARYHYHMSNTFAVGASYFFSYIRADSDTDFGKSLKTRAQHGADAELMISNECAFRAGKTIMQCDLFLTLGGGAMWINNKLQPMGMVGGGMKIYLPTPALAIRFDVNSPLHPTPQPGGNSFNADIMFNLGLSFLFPVRKIAAEEPLEKVIEPLD